MERVGTKKVIRVGKKSCGEIRIQFKWEPKGTRLYLFKEGDNIYRLSKHTKTGAWKNITIWENKAGATAMLVCGMFQDSVEYVDILKDGDDYVLRPATKENIRKYGHIRKSYPVGTIKTNNLITLGEYSNEVFSKRFTEMEVYISDTNMFCKLFPVEQTQCHTAMQLCHNNGIYYGNNLVHYRVRVNNSCMKKKTIQLPAAFVQKAKLWNYSMNVWRDEKEQCIVIAPQSSTCCVTGKAIRKDIDNFERLNVRPEQVKSFNLMQNSIKKLKGSEASKIRQYRQTIETKASRIDKIMEEVKKIIAE